MSNFKITIKYYEFIIIRIKVKYDKYHKCNNLILIIYKSCFVF